jgi:predicted O-methyltransferase YrrM
VSSRNIELTPTLYDYLLAVGTRESADAAELRLATREATRWHRMQIGPEQGAFMALLVRLTAARRILEVGTFTGYSALVMAEALPPEGRLVTCDVSAEWTAVGRPFWERAGVASRIELRLGPAEHTLDELVAHRPRAPFDLAFIDADKTGYDVYYERCLTLLRAGGLLAIDNVLWSGRVANPHEHDEDTRALQALNEKVHADPRVHACMLPIGDGLTLAVKRPAP